MEKRLYRSTNDRVLLGVCGGIAEYLNVDPVIIRLIVVIMSLSGGIGLLAYIVAAIVMKEGDYTMENQNNNQKHNQDYNQANAQGENQNYDANNAQKHGGNQDSYQYNKPANRKGSGSILLGAVFVLMGAGYLTNRYLPWVFEWFEWGVVFAGLAIVFGFVIMFKR